MRRTLAAAALAALALTGCGQATTPVYSQDWRGDHYEGRYACHTTGAYMECEGLPSNLGPYVQCRLRPDGPDGAAFVRCANHPDSNQFSEVK